MSRTQSYKWFMHFKLGKPSINIDPISIQPSISTNNEYIDAVRSVIHENHSLTVRQFAEEIGISIGSCHTILTENLAFTVAQQNWCHGCLQASKKKTV